MGKGLPKSLVSKNVILSQKNKSFMPRVLAVTVGQKVEFRNSDNFHHNVWSLSGAKSFDLGTFKAPNNKSLVFDKVGMVKVFCNIHPQMSFLLAMRRVDFPYQKFPPENIN